MPNSAYAGTTTKVDTESIPAFVMSMRDWHDGVTGNWSQDNALGRKRADELRANIKMTGNAPLLGRLVKMIGENDSFGGVEVGFFQRTAELMAR